MPKVTSGLTISLDGFGAGLNQSFEKPFGDNFDSDLLDRWMFAEPEKHKHKKEIDAILDGGAFIMGSNIHITPRFLYSPEVSESQLRCKEVRRFIS